MSWQWFPVIITIFIVPLRKFTSNAIYIADHRMTQMIELTGDNPYCKFYTNRNDIERLIFSSDPQRVRQVNRESVAAIHDVCSTTPYTSSPSSSSKSIQSNEGGLRFIYPGTKWCGPGSVASHYNDLGQYTEEDKCCREHDYCHNILLPGECRNGLCNRGTFTRSHCDCDARFRNCLQRLNTETANTLGAAFFNVVQVTCFRERYPCSFWPGYPCMSDYYNIGSYVSPNLANKYQQTSDIIRNKLNLFNRREATDYFDDRSFETNGISDSNLFRIISTKYVAKNLIKDVLVKPLLGILGIFKNEDSDQSLYGPEYYTK